MLVDTWKKARFFKNIMKVLIRIVEKVQEKIKGIEEKYELVVYNDFDRDFLGKVNKECAERILIEFSSCDTVAQVRKLFKHYAKYLHSDLGNNKVYDRPVFEWLVSMRDTAIMFLDFIDED